jgi:hypothetical protein
LALHRFRSELEEAAMKSKRNPLTIVTAAMLGGAATLAFAKGDPAFERPYTVAAGLSTTDRGTSERGGITIRMAQQEKSNQDAGQNSNAGNEKSCPPEHKSAGHC